MRWVFTWPYRVALAGLYRAGVKPWQLTVASLIANAIIGWLLLTGRRLVPGLLLMPAGLFDVFDGGLARLRGEEKRSGAFLDAVPDRASDAILFSCLYWSLAEGDRGLEAALALGTLVISLAVSHVRAEAEAVGLRLTEGLFQRLERYVALILGLTIPGALLPALILLAVLGGLTLFQRTLSALRRAPA
jgi:CDP-diacylglycerol--glycerol-3-phosphate 3-phosphatidyltransferase